MPAASFIFDLPSSLPWEKNHQTRESSREPEYEKRAKTSGPRLKVSTQTSSLLAKLQQRRETGDGRATAAPPATNASRSNVSWSVHSIRMPFRSNGFPVRIPVSKYKSLRSITSMLLSHCVCGFAIRDAPLSRRPVRRGSTQNCGAAMKMRPNYI